MKKTILYLLSLAVVLSACNPGQQKRPERSGKILAGAAQVNVSSVEFPVIVNGYFHPRYEDSVS